MNEPLLQPEHLKPASRWAKSLKQPRRFWWYGLIILLIMSLYFLLHTKNNANKNNLTKMVAVASVQKRDVPIYISALGNVVATYTVTLKTQINGLLMRVLFKEGQFVKKGDLLAEIDQRLLQAQLTQYEGQLRRDQALLDNALIDLKRYQTLWKQDSIAQQTLATQVSLVKQYQGAVEVDKGLIETTRVNLIYCKITSPIDGRIGLRLVDPGNFVQTSDTSGLAVITTLNPITVIFSIPENDIPAVVPQAFSDKPMLVQAFDRNEKDLLATGKLLTIDNQINTTTGTINLRAQFNNQDHKLFSNQFVNIKILVNTLRNSIIVPTAAIQHSRQDNFVYRLNPDSTVTTQPVKIGVTNGDDTVILSGLKPGQKVVVEGADKLNNGTRVTIV